jgi:hypothetical protein
MLHRVTQSAMLTNTASQALSTIRPRRRRTRLNVLAGRYQIVDARIVSIYRSLAGDERLHPIGSAALARLVTPPAHSRDC